MELTNQKATVKHYSFRRVLLTVLVIGLGLIAWCDIGHGNTPPLFGTAATNAEALTDATPVDRTSYPLPDPSAALLVPLLVAAILSKDPKGRPWAQPVAGILFALMVLSFGVAFSTYTTPVAAAPIETRLWELEHNRTQTGELKQRILTPASAAPNDRGISEGWVGAVQEDIHQSEYRITWQGPTAPAGRSAAYQAPNRAHNLRTYFTEEGIQITDRLETTPQWILKLSLNGYGREGQIQPTERAQRQVDGNRIEYRYAGGLTEWYINDEQGLEQGFTLTTPPDALAFSPLLLDLAVDGNLIPSLATSTEEIEFITAGGVQVLRYGQLQVTDAAGHHLPAHFELRPFSSANRPGNYILRLAVDDTAAVYPLTIDPLLASPNWTAESNQDSAGLGSSVRTAGDVNGDGYTDVIIGVKGYDGGQTDEGRTYLYYGSASGLSTTPAWTTESDQLNALFGFSVSTAGDVNNDGYADVLVGAVSYDNGQTNEGRVYGYYGSANGLNPTPAWVMENNSAGSSFGSAVSTAGDVNGDGYSDVMVGANTYTNDQSNEGRVYLYYGSASGLSTTPAWTTEGNGVGNAMGEALAAAGDINRDGYGDIVLGIESYDNGSIANTGIVYIYHGSAQGLGTTPNRMIVSTQAGKHLGSSVDTAGDIDGDGHADIIVGAVGHTNGQSGEGQALVYFGYASGLGPTPAWSVESNQASAEFGGAVGTAGDVNGDGYADVMVGARGYDSGQIDEGKVFVYYGSASGLSTTADLTAESDQAGAYFGEALSTAGDVNGDGYTDMIIGAGLYDNGQTNEGRAYLYQGAPSKSPSPTPWSLEGKSYEDHLGYSVNSAGDVNGDGIADIIVGIPNHDGAAIDQGRASVYLGTAYGVATGAVWTGTTPSESAHYGQAVSAAGDINGDDYNDIIVGAPNADSPGEVDDGLVFVYYGTATGIQSTPAITLSVGQSGAHFGATVSSAGDVNGDGYADIVVGAPNYSGALGLLYFDAGRAFVYYGSPAGLSAQANWTSPLYQRGAHFGSAVGTAGDVNGDGYADLAVGAPNHDDNYTDSGMVYVYFGSSNGLSSTADDTATFDQANAYFGTAVSTAGDVNGDGYEDLIIGVPGYYDEKRSETVGLVSLYYGSDDKPLDSSPWSVMGELRDAQFGKCVAAAGDSNGDGYADIAVSAYQYSNSGTNTGKVYLYQGGASGLNSTSAWTLEGQSNAMLGLALNPAGDTNGDGYADLVIGAARDISFTGSAFVYYGNERKGITLNPHQNQGGGAAAPLALGGLSNVPDAFRLAIGLHTPFGRSKVKLEWQVAPWGTPFTAATTVSGTSSNWLDISTNGVLAYEMVSGLESGTPYHWRMRLRYHPAKTPYQQYSRWFTSQGHPGPDVYLPPVAPEANFVGEPVNGQVPLTVNLTDLSTGTVRSRLWKFGDGATSTERNPIHTYGAGGIYTISLTVAGPAGTDTLTRTDYITAVELPAKADFSAQPSTGYIPITVTFHNHSSNATAYQWSFGDGTTSTETQPIHIYETPGVYTVTLAAFSSTKTDVLTRESFINALQLNNTPQITLTAPADGAVVGEGPVQVTGLVSDDRAALTVRVNDIPATIINGIFTATVPVTAGNRTLLAVVEDSSGVTANDSRVIEVDGSGPQVTIREPHNQLAVLSLAPTASISFTDFYTGVNPATFAAQLQDANGVITDVHSLFTTSDEDATGTLPLLSADTIYTLTVSIADRYGNFSTQSSAFYIPVEPENIVPPVREERTGWVNGIVYNSNTCNAHLTVCQGVPGARVTISRIDNGTREITETVPGTLITGPDGFFAFPIAENGTYAVRIAKDGFTYNQREMVLVAGQSTVLDAIYLTPIDTAVTVVSSTMTETAVHTNTDSSLVLEIPPSALAEGQVITVTATNFEHVEFLPSGELPPGTGETYAFNLSGSSEVSFTHPITVRIRNTREFAPDTRIPLGYWNQETLQWEHAGVGIVDESGEWVLTHVQHFSNYDCNSPIWYPGMGGGLNPFPPQDPPCPPSEEGCAISIQSGRVRDWVELPAVNILGDSVAPILSYDTARAHPSAVIDVQLALYFDPETMEDVGDYAQFELYIEGRKTAEYTLAADINGKGEVGRYRYLWDGRNAFGEQLPPGIYAYAVKATIPTIGKRCYALDEVFGNPPDCEAGFISFVDAPQEFWAYGTVALNTQIDTALGNGWVLENMQRLTYNQGGDLLIAEGSELAQYHFDLQDPWAGESQYDLDQPPVAGPAAALTVLPPAQNGTLVSGTVTSDITWTVAGSPYIVTGGDVIVTDGVTLTIEPGVNVLLDQYRNLKVEGALTAIGTPTDPISFTPYTARSYDTWKNYTLDPGIVKVTTVATDTDGSIWFAGHDPNDDSSDPHALARWDADLRNWEVIPTGPQEYEVYDMAADTQGNMWVGTKDGVYQYTGDLRTGGIQYLDQHEVHIVTLDPNNGDVWFGTNDGAWKYTPATQQWERYSTSEYPNLVGDDIYGLAIDESGTIWFGTASGLSRRLPDTTWMTDTYEPISALALDHDGNAWMGVADTGLLVRLADGNWVTYTVASGQLVTNTITSLVVDRDNRKWIGYQDAGLSLVLSDARYSWSHVISPTLSGNNVRDITTSPDGEVWVAVENRAVGLATRIYQDDYRDYTLSYGYWGSLQIGGGNDPADSDGSRLDNVVIAAGGFGYYPSLYLNHSTPTLENLRVHAGGGDGLYAEGSDDLTVANASFESNEGDGLHLERSIGPHTLISVTTQYNKGYGLYSREITHGLTLTNSTVRNNGVAARVPVDLLSESNTWQDNRRNEIEWYGETLSVSRTWDAGVDAYALEKSLTVAPGATLTIAPGSTVRFDGFYTGLTLEGALQAVGTRLDPITFEKNPAADNSYNYWYGLIFTGTNSSQSRLSHATIQHAWMGISLYAQSTPTLDRLNLFNNHYGLRIADNGTCGAIRESNFLNNETLINNSNPSCIVDARYNYWNSPNGPNPQDPNLSHVNFDPWLKKPAFIQDLDYIIPRNDIDDQSVLVYNSGNGTAVRYDQNGRETHFDAQGYHTLTVDRDGRRTVYTYNADGTLATMGILTPGGETAVWTWTFAYESGKLHTITDPAGRITALTIDAAGNLERVTFPDNSTRRFYYDERALLTQQTNAAGETTEYTYNESGRLIAHRDPARPVYDPETGKTRTEPTLRQFTPSDTAYALLNTSTIGNPDTPAPAVITSAQLLNVVTYADGTQHQGHMDIHGRWLDETDALSRTIRYERDAAGNLTAINYPDGSCVEASYDEQNTLISVTRLISTQCTLPPEERDPALLEIVTRTVDLRHGQSKVVTAAGEPPITYTYDYEVGSGNAGNVVKIEYPPVPDADGVLTTPTITRTYNSLGLLAEEKDETGQITRYLYTQGTPEEAAGGAAPLFAPGVTPVPGLLTRLIVDPDGAGLTTIYRDFDTLGNARTLIMPGGQLTRTYAFDSLGRIISETLAGVTNLYEYNALGQTVRQVTDYTPDGITGANIVTTYEYDAAGHLIHERTETREGVQEGFSLYDATGRLIATRDNLGNEIRHVYDEVGREIQTVDPIGLSTFFTYNEKNQLETTTDSQNHITHNYYDDQGRPARTVQAEGELDLTTIYTYSAEGKVTAMQDSTGLVTCHEYDSAGRLSGTIVDCGPQGLNLATRYAFDLAGNTVYMTDTRGIVSYNEYDALGRPVLNRQDINGLNLETRTTYAPNGEISTTVGPDGAITRYEYGLYNRLVKTCQDSAGLNLCTRYGYDRLGRQAVITDAEGTVNRTTYNSFGMPMQEIRDTENEEAGIFYEYDDLFQLIRVTDANGNPIRYTYDSLGRTETEIYADGTRVAYTYDPQGNLHTQTLEDNTVITHTYDSFNRETRIDFSTGGHQEFEYDRGNRMLRTAQSMDGHTSESRYGYDVMGEVVTLSQQLDGGEIWTVGYAYDHKQGRSAVTYPSGLVISYTLDTLNRLDLVTRGDGTPVADYGYDVLNRYNTLAYPNALTNRMDYDAVGRITRARVQGGGQDLTDYRYGYDQVGNRTFQQRAHRAGQPADVYEYDGLYQLTTAWYGADATVPAGITASRLRQDYDLDDLGNRLSVTQNGAVTTYGPNDGTQSTDPLNRYETAGGLAMEYDARGNTLSDGINRYTYDALNRQTHMTNAGGTTEYVYDARGRRLAKVSGSAAIHYLYDAEYRVLEERDGTGALLARYTYGTGMDEPLTMERNGQTYYYHRDALGSITEISDASGALVERYEYDVYGAAVIFNGSGVTLTASAVGNPYRFTGREYDPESGNYNYRARIYSPRLGRFLSRDPLGLEAGDYNLYRYAFNNPTTMTDPTGGFAFIPWLAGAAAEAAIDALMQGVINYYFDPEVTNVQQALDKIDWGQVGLAFFVGLVPGGRLAKAVASAWGEVFLYLVAQEEKDCPDPLTDEEVLEMFATRVIMEYLGDYAGDLIADYGVKAVAAGLKRLGLDKLAQQALDNVDEFLKNFCSFSADTAVVTEEGLVPIEAIEAGDYVLAYDEATDTTGYFPVVSVWSHQDSIIVRLTIDGETLETTPDHPFHTAEDGWLPAANLRPGQQIEQSDGSYGTVTAITFVIQPQPMYNLTVAQAHTYFVGEGQWLVHNKCNLPKKRASPTIYSMYFSEVVLLTNKGSWHTSNAWESANDFIIYHYDKHGASHRDKWPNMQAYTNAAIQFYNNHKDKGFNWTIVDDNITGIKIVEDGFFGIYDQQGKIVSFGIAGQ